MRIDFDIARKASIQIGVLFVVAGAVGGIFDESAKGDIFAAITTIVIGFSLIMVSALRRDK